MKKTKFILLTIVCIIVVFILGFWAGAFYVQVKISEEIRCGELGPQAGNYDSKPCIEAGCKVKGMGEWSCIPKLPFHF